MLRKVLKYDLKYVWRIWWIMAVIVSALSLVGSITLRFFIESLIENPDKIDPMFSLMLFFVLFGCIVAIFGSSIGTLIIVFQRFYKNFYTDEGYLTFTLPVSRKTLFLSKTINAVIWLSAHSVLLVGCVAMFFLISPPADTGVFNLVVFEGLGEGFSLLFEGLGAWTVAYVIVLLICSVASLLFSVVVFHLCITIGAIVAKKHKILSAIGIYFGFNIVSSIVMEILGTLGLRVFAGTADKVFVNVTSTAQVHLLILSIILLIAAVMATAAIGIWCGNLSLIERKLNLA